MRKVSVNHTLIGYACTDPGKRRYEGRAAADDGDLLEAIVMS